MISLLSRDRVALIMYRQPILPDDYDEYAREVEPKGYFTDAVVRVGERNVPVTFYPVTRAPNEWVV